MPSFDSSDACHSPNMTAVLGLKVSNGIVLGVDGRICADTTVNSDSTPKWMVTNNILAAWAGDLGAIQQTQRLWRAEEPTTLDECAGLVRGSVNAWDAVVFDRLTGELALLASDHSMTAHDPFCVVGSGADVMYGYLRGSVSQPTSYRGARKYLSQVLGVAAERDSMVCGDFHLVTWKFSGEPEVHICKNGILIE